MHVHYQNVKQALEIGCYISQLEDNYYRIYWPSSDVELFGESPDKLIAEMKAIQNGAFNEEKPAGVLNNENHIAGIPKHGGHAYREGVPASDCPYPEESDDFPRWNNEWDEAADAEEAVSQVKPGGIGSVVTNRYRAKYTESGHPTHCGDQLANLLNQFCQNRAGTNLGIFEAICAANGVSLVKYNRTAKGWQGRLRMTGRNLLSKRLIATGGKLMMPEGWIPEYYQLDEDWVIQTTIKYKPKDKS
jgi:hypothetical protein